jgi:hypothetical protein
MRLDIGWVFLIRLTVDVTLVTALPTLLRKHRPLLAVPLAETPVPVAASTQSIISWTTRKTRVCLTSRPVSANSWLTIGTFIASEFRPRPSHQQRIQRKSRQCRPLGSRPGSRQCRPLRSRLGSRQCPPPWARPGSRQCRQP